MKTKTFRHCNSHIFQAIASPLTSWFCYFLSLALFFKKREASSMDKNFHIFSHNMVLNSSAYKMI